MLIKKIYKPKIFIISTKSQQKEQVFLNLTNYENIYIVLCNHPIISIGL